MGDHQSLSDETDTRPEFVVHSASKDVPRLVQDGPENDTVPIRPTLDVKIMGHRFFAENRISSSRVELTGAESHHLQHVLRAQVGNEVVLFDGSGKEFVARDRQDRPSPSGTGRCRNKKR